jgi:hypothetical protein
MYQLMACNQFVQGNILSVLRTRGSVGLSQKVESVTLLCFILLLLVFPALTP